MVIRVSINDQQRQTVRQVGIPTNGDYTAKTDLALSTANAANMIAIAALAASALSNVAPAFDKANSANVLAYNTGTGANAYSATVGTSANAFASATIAGANTAVGTGANAYSATVGTSANAFASATIAGANNISIASFDRANVINVVANLAFDKANSANIIAVAAFDAANVSRSISTFVNKSQNYNILTSDYCINFSSCSANAVLPHANNFIGKEYVIKNSNSILSGNLINIQTTASQTIDGDGYIILSPLSALTVISDNTNWIII